MTHALNLCPSPFEMIRSGRKTIELRLYDEKRRKLQPGDIIIFSNTSCAEQQITAAVKKLHIFDSFTDLYKALPLEQCGYLPNEAETASPEDMLVYYSMEKQLQHGVVGIEIQVQQV